MIIRLVKLSFFKENINSFLSIFEANKHKIRSFEGCEFLELYHDKNQTNIFFTYSFWSSETALNEYRNSELFKAIWIKTKVLFSAKPEAWSLDKLESLN